MPALSKADTATEACWCFMDKDFETLDRRIRHHAHSAYDSDAAIQDMYLWLSVRHHLHDLDAAHMAWKSKVVVQSQNRKAERRGEKEIPSGDLYRD